MTTNIRIKTKLNPPRILSDQNLLRGSSKKPYLATCRSDILLSNYSKNFNFTANEAKLHGVNLQIPSLNSPDMSISSKNTTKKSACIKGFTSKMHARPDKPKKFTREEKNSEIVEGTFIDDKNLSGKNLKGVKSLEDELKKAYHENKKLKKMMKEEKMNEQVVEEMMNSFKARLYKFLYD